MQMERILSWGIFFEV